METFWRTNGNLCPAIENVNKSFVCSEPDRIRIGDWGSACVRACVRAKLCAGARQRFLWGRFRGGFGQVSGRFRVGFGEVSGRFRGSFGEVSGRFRGGFG